MWSWNLVDFYQLCGAMSPIGKLVLISDLAIAFAYFSIPVGILIVKRLHEGDLPYPWLLGLFASFITACGLSHLVMALQMPWTTFEHTVPEAVVKVITATLSVLTAIAMLCIMPAVRRIISPKVRQQELEDEVSHRTKENTDLVFEINHQLGNQLQNFTSMLRIEQRKLRRGSNETAEMVLERLMEQTEEINAKYHEDAPKYLGFRPSKDGKLPSIAAE